MCVCVCVCAIDGAAPDGADSDGAAPVLFGLSMGPVVGIAVGALAVAGAVVGYLICANGKSKKDGMDGGQQRGISGSTREINTRDVEMSTREWHKPKAGLPTASCDACGLPFELAAQRFCQGCGAKRNPPALSSAASSASFRSSQNEQSEYDILDK